MTAGDDVAQVARFLKPGCDTYTARTLCVPVGTRRFPSMELLSQQRIQVQSPRKHRQTGLRADLAIALPIFSAQLAPGGFESAFVRGNQPVPCGSGILVNLPARRVRVGTTRWCGQYPRGIAWCRQIGHEAFNLGVVEHGGVRLVAQQCPRVFRMQAVMKSEAMCTNRGAGTPAATA